MSGINLTTDICVNAEVNFPSLALEVPAPQGMPCGADIVHFATRLRTPKTLMEHLSGGRTEEDRFDPRFEKKGSVDQCDRTADRPGSQDRAQISGARS